MLTDGRWGATLNELLLRPDECGIPIPVARMGYSLSDNDKDNMIYSTKVVTDIPHAGGAIMALASRLAARTTSGTAMDDDPAARSCAAGAACSGSTRRRW